MITRHLRRFALAGLVSLLVSMLSSCTPLPPVTPAYNATSCAAGCSRARELCGPTTLTPRKGTCEDVCEAAETNGGNFRTGCLSAATTCEAVRSCSG